MKTYYAEIYVPTARPTGRIEPKENLDADNEITMQRWDELGTFESLEAAEKKFGLETTYDDRGFLQWKN